VELEARARSLAVPCRGLGRAVVPACGAVRCRSGRGVGASVPSPQSAIGNVELPVVAVRDARDDRQLDARPVLIGGEAALGDVTPALGRDTGTVVGDVEAAVEGADPDRHVGTGVFDGVDEAVLEQQSQLSLGRVDDHRFGDVEAERRPIGGPSGDRPDVRDHRVEVSAFERRVGLVAPRQRLDVVDELVFS